MDEEKKQLLQVHLQEYSKLKDEQARRIGFRDNLLYFTLGVFGVVLTFSFGEQTQNSYGLIFLPFVCLILGWTYLVNDQKISSIANYLRDYLSVEVANIIGNEEQQPVFGWEIKNLENPRRKQRKVMQLVIDEIAFVLSGSIGIFVFWYIEPDPPLIVQLLSWFELLLLVILGWEISKPKDSKVNRENLSEC